MNYFDFINVIFKPNKTLDMEGILYLIDENNKKKFVQIDLNKYGEVWQDFYDGLMAEMNKGEESYPLDEVISELETKGNLNKYV